MSNFGDKLKEIRKKNKLSLKEVAKKGGLSHSYISQIENGKRNAPKPETIHKLAKGLGIDPNILMEEAGYIKKSTNEINKEIARLQEEYSKILSDNIEENFNILNEEILDAPIDTPMSIIKLIEMHETIQTTRKSSKENGTLDEDSKKLDNIQHKLSNKPIGTINSYKIDILDLINLDIDLYYDQILLTKEDKHNIIKFMENFIIG